jgi:hypothetical protein
MASAAPASTPTPTATATAAAAPLVTPNAKAGDAIAQIALQAPTLWKVIQDYVLYPMDSVVKTVPEVGHLSPVIMTFGTLFVAFITLNYPLFVLGLSSAEAYLVYNTISGVSSLAVTPFSGVRTEASKGKGECSSFYQGLSPSRFEYFMKRGLIKEFPNTPLYFICFAAAYCIQSMFFFSKESSELGPSYSNRIYLSLLATGMFIVLYTLYLIINGCDGIFSLLATIVIGLLVGYLICYQNYFLLGKSSVDLIFVPILGKRSGMDYVCVRTKST